MILAILILAGGVAIAWTFLAIRLLGLSRSRWFQFLQPIDSVPATGPTVSVVVPARNEAMNVGATLEALRAQEYPNLTITVVDDQSTDETAEVLDRISSQPDPRAPLRYIRGVERPDGWVGKTWAVHQGAAGSTSDWIWFVDADMGLNPKALASAMAAAEVSRADFVSLLPGVVCRTFWQGTIATSLVQLLGQLYPLDRVNDPNRPEAIAAGGFILVRRSTYEQAGGHEAVRKEIIEDIELARRVKATGGKLLVQLAPALVWTHMYGNFGEIWRGLRKNAYAGMEYMPHKYITGAMIALTLAWAPWFALASSWLGGGTLAIGIGTWGILAQAIATAPILVFLGLPFLFAFTLPAGITAYVAIATSSVWHHHQGRILWKGRAIPSGTVLKVQEAGAESPGRKLLESRPEK